ncbi:hypothetical protein DKG77_02725 [Flagellimonas aquimarina]|uniref:Bacteriophage abortive infection AbiH n=1 Tax=Flagellimonas aquimarina TaxID=2201895 RepID=A0A316KZY8_9FLAO|nr:AbiH family protein [Allomuricauda koreensis]PWL39762.1 hypothetical protein DKG77_02725 [Allomuricauda koreensis]
MNKLVIVGNGFDLAHELPTSYSHFIDYFWSNLGLSYQEKIILDMVYVNPEFDRVLTINSIKSFKDFLKNLEEYCQEYSYNLNEENLVAKNKESFGKEIFKFNNLFFKELNIKSLENWVDIENEYFIQLKTISKRKIVSYSGSREKAEKNQEKKNKEAINKLNKEFEEVKKLLKFYLTKSTCDKYEFLNGRISNFQNLLRYFEVRSQNLNNSNQNREFLNEFPLADHSNIIEFDTELRQAELIGQAHKFLANSNKKTVFLNFNYTDSLYPYIEIMKTQNYGYYLPPEEIPIHGRLKNTLDYEMIFGFGDEMDEDYKFIENLNQNEYLSNFKSFKYSRTHYYKKLLDYIDSEMFQVFIMGHSCGLSDRTMLNTIFEHKNCRSIKVFFHEWENHNGKKMDNFTEIVQNISRHFNDKKLMREKVVNKSLCYPLPQDMRFEKKGV